VLAWRKPASVARIELADLINLGEEFFLWEMATAVAGSILGINAFDQPMSRRARLHQAFLEEFRERTSGGGEPILIAEGIRIYGDEANRKALKGRIELKAMLAAISGRIQAGDMLH